MSYNLIKNFWCIASILNINMFHDHFDYSMALKFLKMSDFKIPKLHLELSVEAKGNVIITHIH